MPGAPLTPSSAGGFDALGVGRPCLAHARLGYPRDWRPVCASAPGRSPSHVCVSGLSMHVPSRRCRPLRLEALMPWCMGRPYPPAIAGTHFLYNRGWRPMCAPALGWSPSPQRAHCRPLRLVASTPLCVGRLYLAVASTHGLVIPRGSRLVGFCAPSRFDLGRLAAGCCCAWAGRPCCPHTLLLLPSSGWMAACVCFRPVVVTSLRLRPAARSRHNRRC